MFSSITVPISGIEDNFNLMNFGIRLQNEFIQFEQVNFSERGTFIIHDRKSQSFGIEFNQIDIDSIFPAALCCFIAGQLMKEIVPILFQKVNQCVFHLMNLSELQIDCKIIFNLS